MKKMYFNYMVKYKQAYYDAGTIIEVADEDFAQMKEEGGFLVDDRSPILDSAEPERQKGQGKKTSEPAKENGELAPKPKPPRGTTKRG